MAKKDNTKPVKMSKSLGNVVTIDEVVYGVANVADGFEFRNVRNEPIDYKEWGVWQDMAGTGFYYTSTRTKKQPAWLCQIGDPGAAVLLIDGEEKEQHPGYEEVAYYVFRKKEDKPEIEEWENEGGR